MATRFSLGFLGFSALSATPVLSLRVYFSSRRRHTWSKRDWSSDVCSSDLLRKVNCEAAAVRAELALQDPPGNSFALAQALHRVAHIGYALLRSASPAVRGRAKLYGLDERSAERRVGKECVCRGSPYYESEY